MNHDINDLKRSDTTLARNTSGGWVRIASSSSSSSGGTDPRLIRGTVTANVHAEDDTFAINNIFTLASGLDPRTDPTSTIETVEIQNLQTENFSAGDLVTAIYNAAASNWEILLVEEYRLIRGTVASGVNADATTLNIKNIQVLSGGVDPRTDPSDSTETLTVTLIESCCFATDERVTATYNDTADQWEVLLTERFRSIRGTWYSGTTTLLIDHIVVLDNGLDPRTDTTSNTETVSVANVASDTYGSGDKVYADYNAKDGIWEARPKAGAGSALVWGKVTTQASASGTWDTPSTDGRCTLGAAWGSTTGVIITNYYPDIAPVGAVICLDGTTAVSWSCGTL